jgi:hypothetical protein
MNAERVDGLRSLAARRRPKKIQERSRAPSFGSPARGYAVWAELDWPCLKPSLRSSPVTPPIFRSLGQPETRFADEKVVTQ